MDDVSWGALAVALAIVGGLYTWYAYRRRGVGAGLRGAGLTVLPIAAYLTRTLQLLGDVVDDVGRWATGLVFHPTVWVGIALAGLAAVLYVAGSAVLARQGPESGRRSVADGSEAGALGARGSATRASRAPKPAASAKGGTGDPDLDEIEALLRKRGIS